MSEMAGTLTTAKKGSGDYIGVGSGPLSGGYGDNPGSLNPHVVNINELVPPEIQALIEAGATPEQIAAAMKKKAAEYKREGANAAVDRALGVLNTPPAEEVGFDEAKRLSQEQINQDVIDTQRAFSLENDQSSIENDLTGWRSKQGLAERTLNTGLSSPPPAGFNNNLNRDIQDNQRVNALIDAGEEANRLAFDSDTNLSDNQPILPDNNISNPLTPPGEAPSEEVPPGEETPIDDLPSLLDYFESMSPSEFRNLIGVDDSGLSFSEIINRMYGGFTPEWSEGSMADQDRGGVGTRIRWELLPPRGTNSNISQAAIIGAIQQELAKRAVNQNNSNNVEEEPLYPEQGMGGEPSIPRDQLPDNKEDLLLGIENGTIDFRAVPTSVFNELDINQTEITNATTVFAEGMEGTPPERLGEATDDERKQQLIDGVANGDIDPLLISKGELTALGIEGKDLVLPAPSEDFITKTREKIMGTIGDLADDLGPAIAKAAAPPSLEEMLDPNNGAAWQIGVRIDANGDSQLFVKIGLPIPGLTGDGWEIDLTKDGQLVIDDAIRRKAGEIWGKVQEIPEKIGGWWGGVLQEIEDAGEDIQDATQDKDGNVLITVIESTGKVVKRVLRPLEIFLPQVDLSKDPMYGAKVRNGVLGVFILGKIADKIKNKDKPSSSPPAGEGGVPPGEVPPGEAPLGDSDPEGNPFTSTDDKDDDPDKDKPSSSDDKDDDPDKDEPTIPLDNGENDPDDNKPSSSPPIPPDGGPTIPPDSGADADAGGGNNPFFSIPGGSNRNRRTEEYESKEGGALEYFFNMAGTSIFATAEQEADFLSAYMRIMDRRKAEDREVSPDKLISPLTGVNISNPNKKTSEEDEPIIVQKASGGLINGNFMNEYNRIMRHRVG